jgi:hypothetical protein
MDLGEPPAEFFVLLPVGKAFRSRTQLGTYQYLVNTIAAKRAAVGTGAYLKPDGFSELLIEGSLSMESDF